MYRGSKLPQNIFQTYKDIKEKGDRLTLLGFTSTSEDINVAFRFMFNQLKSTDVPVLYQIKGANAYKG